MDTASPLLTPADLAKLMGYSETTIKAKASRSPGDLPPRVPGGLLRWHPKTYEDWATNTKKPGPKIGRPRK